MLKNQHISIVVPIKNEAENIQKLTREINKACNKIKFEILFVNDGSNDNSCLLYTSPSPRDTEVSRMPSSA